MRKLCLVPALLLAAASASAETPVKLWNDYVYNQPVESVKAEAGIFDCSQRGQQMFCRANVEFAGHKDWGEVFFFTNGRLKAVSLFAPISRAHFTDAAAAVRKTGMTPAVLTDHEDKVAFDFFQAKLQAKSMASIDRELATKETELLKGKKVGYVFIDAKTLLESVKSGNVTNARQFFQITPRAPCAPPRSCSTNRAFRELPRPDGRPGRDGQEHARRKEVQISPTFRHTRHERPVSAAEDRPFFIFQSLPRDSYFASAAFSRLAWRARSTSITSASSRSASARSTSR